MDHGIACANKETNEMAALIMAFPSHITILKKCEVCVTPGPNREMSCVINESGLTENYNYCGELRLNTRVCQRNDVVYRSL